MKNLIPKLITFSISLMKKAILILILLYIWKIASSYVNPVLLPSPEVVLADLIETIHSGMLLKALKYSFVRITIATILSALVAIPIGILAHNFKLAKDFLYPVINAMRFIPITAFYPLIIMWFGIDEAMKIVFLFLATFVYMMPSTVLALDEVSPNLFDTAYTLGMNRWQTIFQVQLPAVLPSLMNSFIMMYGIGWTYIAVTESVNGRYGLGYTLQQSSSRGRTDLVMMSIIVIIVVSVAFDFIANRIVRKVFKWRYLNNDSAE